MKANTVKKDTLPAWFRVCESNTVKKDTLPAWFRVCEFNPKRDVAEVEQGLAVDINEALRTGVVKDSDYALDYNGIDDPSKIVGRVSDVFDAIEANRVVKKYGKRTKVEDIAVSGATEAPVGVSDSSN